MPGCLKFSFNQLGAAALFLLLYPLWIAAAFADAPQQSKHPPDLATAITLIAKKAIPAVVHVEVTQRSELISPLFPFEKDPSLRRYFDIPKEPKKLRREVKGIGTGMLIDAAGHVLTNSHVVEIATKIQVVLADGRQFTAKLIGADSKTDLAVIKITDSVSFPFLKFGDSDKVEVGQWVIAIGHPRGLDQTVTAGIISAKNRRSIIDPSSYQDFLQTDAAINPGNSGGPLLNLYGEVIGINSAIASSSGGFEGIGFAIPSNMASLITKELMLHGKVARGWLGVSVQDLSYEQAKAHGLSTSKGALVAEVVKDSPAERAGILAGDIILDYKGQQISDSSELRNDVAKTSIGETVTLTIQRKEKKITLTVRIGNLETATKAMQRAVEERLGAEFRSVTVTELEKYGMEEKIGVAIASLSQESTLQEEGLEVNDIILAINGRIIENMDAFISAITAVPPNQKISILVLDHRTGNKGVMKVLVK